MNIIKNLILFTVNFCIKWSTGKKSLVKDFDSMVVKSNLYEYYLLNDLEEYRKFNEWKEQSKEVQEASKEILGYLFCGEDIPSWLEPPEARLEREEEQQWIEEYSKDFREEMRKKGC